MRRGSATVLSIVIMLVVFTAGGALLAWITNESRLAPDARDVLEAQYAAEAGAKRAIVEFNKINAAKTPDWSWLNTDRPFTDAAGKTYAVAITGLTSTSTSVPAGTYTITSVGKVGKAAKMVKVSVKVTVETGGEVAQVNDPDSPFFYAGYSKGTTTFGKAPTINRSILDWPDQLVRPYGYVGNSNYSKANNATSNDAKMEKLHGERKLPAYSAMISINDPNKPKYECELPYDHLTGTYVISRNSNISDATISVDGNLRIESNNTLANVNLFVSGTLIMGNVNFSGKCLIVAQDDIVGTDNNNFEEAVVMTYGDLSLTNVNITGTVIAEKRATYFGANPNITYSSTVVQHLLSPAGSGVKSATIQPGSWSTL